MTLPLDSSLSEATEFIKAAIERRIDDEEAAKIADAAHIAEMFLRSPAGSSWITTVPDDTRARLLTLIGACIIAISRDVELGLPLAWPVTAMITIAFRLGMSEAAAAQEARRSSGAEDEQDRA